MKIKVGGACVNQIPLHWKNNTDNILHAIEEAKAQGIRILCLPELCITGYGCEDVFLSEWLPARALQELLHIQSHIKDITVCLGLPLVVEGQLFNAVAVIQNGRLLGFTCKQFLARDGVHYEPRWFNPWPAGKVSEVIVENEKIPAGDVTYAVEGISLGFEICEDSWRKTFRPGYRLKDRGVNLIFNPSASHFAMGKSQLREAEVVSDGSSFFNCVYVFANLLGNESGRMIYDGDIIIGQKGKLLAVNKRLSFQPFRVLGCEVDFENAEYSEYIPSFDIKDTNQELTQAVSLALFDYLRKSRSKGFVLSLSGGADSSTCAVLVAEMLRRASTELGWDKLCQLLPLPTHTNSLSQSVNELLTCAYQASENSSRDTYSSAEALATSIHAKFVHWHIGKEVTSYVQKIEAALGRPLTWDQDDIALQNIQARTRSPAIWMLANVKNAILLTTSNRSEGDVGYATMDGDTSGSLAPIAGLSKPFILQWLKWAESSLGYAGLAQVNALQPTAELRPSDKAQTDEGDLMPYAILTAIEREAILLRKSPVETFEALRHQFGDFPMKAFVVKFFRLWSANQWKRERFAPSFHLDELNVDPRTWCRFPILSSGYAEELALLDTR